MEKSFSGKPTSTRAKPQAGANLIYLLPDGKFECDSASCAKRHGFDPQLAKICLCLFFRYYFMATYNFYIDGSKVDSSTHTYLTQVLQRGIFTGFSLGERAQPRALLARLRPASDAVRARSVAQPCAGVERCGDSRTRERT